MKKASTTVLWLFSIILGLTALALLSYSALSCAMLLGCAVFINPVFIEKVQLKKGLTALLAIGLFIGSVAVFPSTDHETVPKPVQSIQSLKIVIEETQQPENVAKSYDAVSPQVNSAEGFSRSEGDSRTRVLTDSPTPTSNSTATPKPTSTPTPEPTATPKPSKTPKTTLTPKPVTRSVGITILDYSDTVGRGEYAYIKIQGAPNTDYDCEVEYKSGMSTAQGLGVKQSDGNGKVSWKWKVGSRTSLDYTPTIYIDGGGDSISVDFEVVK